MTTIGAYFTAGNSTFSLATLINHCSSQVLHTNIARYSAHYSGAGARRGAPDGQVHATGPSQSTFLHAHHRLEGGLLIAPQLGRHVLVFSPLNERDTTLHLQVKDWSLPVVSAHEPNSIAEYPALFGALGGVLEAAQLQVPSFWWET